MNDTYPVGLACTAIELHEYPTGVRIRPFTITPPEPSQIYTFFVYHQPFREPQLSFRDVRPARRHRGTCPAPTEMNRTRPAPTWGSAGLPRTRGDDPS